VRGTRPGITGVVTLRDVTADNWQAAASLELDSDQEDLVASNAESLEESRCDPDARPRAIYVGERLVGFLMYDAGDPDDDPREATIYRFMIDRNHQGRGFGRAALSKVLDEIRAIKDVRKVSINYAPENPVTKAFYASFGFKETGLDEDGEVVAELVL
jgi:diamine N-acetyltransferase